MKIHVTPHRGKVHVSASGDDAYLVHAITDVIPLVQVNAHGPSCGCVACLAPVDVEHDEQPGGERP